MNGIECVLTARINCTLDRPKVSVGVGGQPVSQSHRGGQGCLEVRTGLNWEIGNLKLIIIKVYNNSDYGDDEETNNTNYYKNYHFIAGH